ncbi:MAG TPA: DUF3145 domain-containing protein [Jatrophihabitans sp.]|jgi:hypothetical protein
MSAAATKGVVYLHACPPAIAPHVEWALAGVLGSAVRMEWTAQPASPASLRAEATWVGRIGTGSRLAAALRAWPMLVFEVTEDGTSLSDGERVSYMPGRGFHRSMTASNGDIVIDEERLRGLVDRARDAQDFRHGLAELLGSSWDAELEPYRTGAWGEPVTLLHQVV